MADRPRPLIDCDVHCAVPSMSALLPYLPDYWRDFVVSSGIGEPTAVKVTYPPRVPSLATPGADLTLELLQQRVLTRAEMAILNCYFGVESYTHPYFGPAVATAVNRWLQEHWLDRDERLRASAVVTPQHPSAAADEIERVAADGRFVQVLLPAWATAGYGAEHYLPIWDAVAQTGLRVAIAYGGGTGTPPTPMGWPASLFETYVTATLAFQSHITSLVFGGVFERHPDLRVVMLESGWTWLPALLWRLDDNWRAFQREVPWVRSPASAYVRRHFRFTTSPCDRPGERRSPARGDRPDRLGGDAHLRQRLSACARARGRRHPRRPRGR